MIGRRLSHYDITAKLGEGGMGQLYRARDTSLGREVALKLLPPDLEDEPEVLERFEREARTLASLKHPNIVTIHSVEEARGIRFLVMELIEGEELSRRIPPGGMRILDFLDVAVPLADALAAAHGHGVVHRDLKPGNVMLTNEGAVVVLDFGLAKLRGAADSGERTQAATEPLTAEGRLLGTLPYMSPEQLEGEAVDFRSDIFSLGVVLYEMATGERPFRGAGSASLISSIVRDTPRRVDQKRTQLPRHLGRIIRRCLEKERGRRYQSTRDLVNDLADLRGELAEAQEQGRGAGRPGAPRLAEKSFRLSAEVCRHLDRETLDPRVIGDEILYLDNERSSDVLVCLLPGLGLDHRIFEETLSRSRFRCLATTFYGCEPAPEYRIVMPMSDQLVVLRYLLEDALERIAPRVFILAGYSLGADAVLRMPREAGFAPERVDGILSLGCNLSFETCVFSARLAEVAGATTEEMVPALRAIGDSVATLDEWVQFHRYLSEVVWKYRSDFGVLRSGAEWIVEPFRDPAAEPFSEWYRFATEHGIAVRCVFTDTEHERKALRGLRLRNLDLGDLGERYDDDDFFTESGKNHFDLLEPQIIERHLDWLVRRIGERRSA